MAEGNGTDLGTVVAMLGAVLQAQEQFRGELGQQRGELGLLRAVLERHIANTRQEFADLRATIQDYHHAVIGHGITLTEHGERLDRLEAGAGTHGRG